MTKKILLLFLLTVSAFSSGEESDAKYYRAINTIYGFKLSDAKVYEVFEHFKLTAPTIHGENHELAEVCIKNAIKGSEYFNQGGRVLYSMNDETAEFTKT